jgi:hypothetical protein
MSNTNDPKPTSPENPDQPNPTDAEAAKKKAEEARERSGGSSFDFGLPGESYGDLAPVPSPDTGDSSLNNPKLPPRPSVRRPTGGSFDFIDLESEAAALSNPDAQAPPPAQPTAPALLVPTPNAFELPPPPERPLPSTDIVIELPPVPPGLVPTPNTFQLPPAPGQPAAPGEPLFTPTDSVIVLPGAPAAPPKAPTPSDASVSIDPAVPMAFSMSSSEFDLGAQPTDPTPSSQIPEGVAASSPDIELPPSEEAEHRTIPEGFAASMPDLNLDSSTVVTPAVPVPEGVAASTTDLDLTPPADAPPAEIPSGFAASVTEIDVAEPAALQTPAVPEGLPASSLELDLPPESDEPAVPTAFAASSADIDLGELPDIPEGQPVSDTKNVADIGVLPPTSDPPSSFVLGQDEAPPPPQAPSEPSLPEILPPAAIPVTDPSIGSVGSLGSMGSISVPDISILYPEPSNEPGSFTAGDNAIAELELPPVAPSATDSTVGRGPIRPVATGDWLDSDDPIARTDPDVVPMGAQPVSDPTEGSDIFSNRSAPVIPSPDQSDVIAATAYPQTPTDPDIPPEPARPSEIALTFEGPPGGSTSPEFNTDDLPLAPELPDDSALLSETSGDPESIHDLPDPARDPLFDSATLAETPELPTKSSDDAPDYGTAPDLSPDASSILADLTDPSVHLTGSSSSVQVEKPGVGPTLTGSPAKGKFDLTVPDSELPLFDEAGEATGADSTDWQQQSGSDLFATRTTADVDLAGQVEPVDANLSPDQPSLSSAPSSIFTSPKPPTGTASDAQTAAPEPTDPDLDEAEFSPRTARRPSSAEFELPPPIRTSSGEIEISEDVPTPPEGEVDWNAVDDSPDASRGIPPETSLSAIMRELTDDADQTKDSPPVLADDNVDDEGKPIVTVDWMAGSAEGSAVTDLSKSSPTAKKKPPREPDFSEKPTKPSGVQPAPAQRKPTSRKTAPVPDTGSAERVGTDSTERAKVTPAKAKKGGGMITGMVFGAVLAAGAAGAAYFGGLGDRGAEEKKRLQDQVKQLQEQVKQQPGTTAPAADPLAALRGGNAAEAVKLAKATPAETPDAKAIAGQVLVFAAIRGAASDDDRNKGREHLQAVIDVPEAAKTPEGARRARDAAIALGVSFEAAGEATRAREVLNAAKAKYPTYAEDFDANLDRLSTPPAPGASFNGPRRLTPAEAERLLLEVTILLAQDPPAPKAEDDPEPGRYYWKAVKLADAKDYAKAIEQITEAKKAHVKRAKALAGRGLNPLTDPLEQMFPRACDEMIAAWKLMDQLYRHPATADAMKKSTLPKALDGFASAAKDLETANTNLKTANENLKTANGKVKTLEGEVEKLGGDVKAAKKAQEEAEGKLATAKKELGVVQTKLATAESTAGEKDKLLKAIGAELAPAKVLPEKWTEKDLVAGVKTVAGLAGGTDAQALVKAKKEAEEAKQKLDTETKALTKKYEGEITKLKEANANEVAKLTDKFKEEAKKEAAAHKLALEAEQTKTAEAKKSLANQAITHQKQLANAVTPAQAVDIWLPVLTDLRRPTDADPAMAIADRALKSSTPGSEEEAKAQTAIGMALLLKKDLAGARIQFQAAIRSPAYKAAAGKYWTKVADNGLDATVDPLALYRLPVVIPPVDPKAATKALDAGISAFKREKYDEAATALTDAAKNDPTDPVAWYYLGAARWALGDENQAKKDITQGAEREKRSVVPGRVVSTELAPIQGRARDAIDRVRP